jgi:hypothetical protein
MVLIVIGNFILLFLLFSAYNVLKAQLKKRMLFDVSLLYRFKYTIIPTIVGLFNVIILSLFAIKWLPIAILVLAIPVLTFVRMTFRHRKEDREFLKLREAIEPIIQSEMNKKQLSIDPGSIHIRILDEKEKGKKKIEIILDVPSKSPEYLLIKRSVLNELNAHMNSTYVLDLLLNASLKKKNNLSFGF